MPNWDSLLVLTWVGCAALSIISLRAVQALELAATVRSPTRIDRVAAGVAKAAWVLSSVVAGGGAVLGMLGIFFLTANFAARSMCGTESRYMLFTALFTSAILALAALRWAMPRLRVGEAAPIGSSSPLVIIPVWLVASCGVVFVLSASFGILMFAVSGWGACN
jgi:hypothetical protein